MYFKILCEDTLVRAAGVSFFHGTPMYQTVSLCRNCLWGKRIENHMDNRENKQSLAARKKVICDLVRDPIYVPMKEKELAMFLQVEKEDRELLRDVLRELLAEGKLTLTPPEGTSPGPSPS